MSNIAAGQDGRRDFLAVAALMRAELFDPFELPMSFSSSRRLYSDEVDPKEAR